MNGDRLPVTRPGPYPQRFIDFVDNRSRRRWGRQACWPAIDRSLGRGARYLGVLVAIRNVRDVKPVTDPAILSAIEAAFTLDVYVAARRAELRRLGLVRLPPQDQRAPKLLLRVRAHLAGRESGS